MPSEQPREGARVHELKTLPGFIDAIEESGKTFEVRNNDRRFKTGDTLHLREYDPDEGYSGREIHRRVGYILDGFPGIEKGYCVMALEPAQPQPREGMRAHSYPLTPIKGRRGWYRCERCGEEYSEAWPTAMGCAPPCEPAQPQPREGTQVERCVTCGSPVEVVTSDEGTSCYRPAQPEQPRGKGDDLAARIDPRADEFVAEYRRGWADGYNARASTHPEQSGRVGRELLELLYTVADELRTDLAIGDEPLPATWGNFCDGINKVERHLGLREPASPTPTEQGEARVECPSCGSNHPGRKKAVQHSPGRPFASKWCDDGFHEPAPEGEGEAS